MGARFDFSKSSNVWSASSLAMLGVVSEDMAFDINSNCSELVRLKLISTKRPCTLPHSSRIFLEAVAAYS